MKELRKEDIEKLAQLSCIALDDGEAQALARAIGTLAELVSPLTLGALEEEEEGEVFAVTRKDEATQGLSREELMRLAPDKEDGFYRLARGEEDKR